MNAALIERVLRGDKFPLRDWVLAGAAPGFLVSGVARTLEEGVLLARDSIDSGKSLAILERWREFSS